MDQANPVTYDQISSKNLHHQYHQDELGNRISYEATTNRATYFNIPFLYSTVGYNVYFDRQGKDIMYDGNGMPRAWNKYNDYYMRTHLLNDSVLKMTDYLSNKNQLNRFSFAAFNTNARGYDINNQIIESQGWTDFTSDVDFFKEKLNQVIPYADQQKKVTVASQTPGVSVLSSMTNYTAGMLSANKLFAEDTAKDNGHEKFVVFFSDGVPNYGQSTLDLLDDGSQQLAAGFDVPTAVSQAKTVAANIIEQNNVTMFWYWPYRERPTTGCKYCRPNY